MHIRLRTLRTLVFFVLSLSVAACGKPPDAIIGMTAGVGSDTGTVRRQIYLATTRAPDDDPTIFFSGERGETLSFARVSVTVPPNHTVGEIERPWTLPPNPRADFTIVDPIRYESGETFSAQISQALLSRPPGERNVLLFVHGYNTSLTSALLQTAQFVHDSGYTGVPVLFSWASRGKTFDYVYDLNSAAMARDALIETAFIVGEDMSVSERYDVVAHSMGNLLTVEAMRQAAIQGTFDESGKIGAVILASPDIDVDLFRSQIELIAPERRRFYVLVSGDDKALATSRWLAGGINRVGDADDTRLADLGVVVIDLSKLKANDSYNHGKFADAPEAVQLIGSSLLSGTRLEGATPPSLQEFLAIKVLE